MIVEADQDSQFKLDAVLGGKYRLHEELGAGGFGRVYLATHLDLGTKVAIKVGRTTANPAALLREARLAAGLSSPHSVRVYDVGSATDGTPYIVMEYLDGCTLREYLAKEGSVAPHVAVSWCLQVCAALTEAHSKGLIHRDLKPSNLFLVRGAPGEWSLKLVDFGLAKTLQSSEETGSDSSVVAGTPAYMAPERLRCNETSVATDVWSLGVVLFEMLTCQTPFVGKTNAAMLAAIVADLPRSLRDVAPDCPASLDSIVGRCLRKHPRERYASIADVARALTVRHEHVEVRLVPTPSTRAPDHTTGSNLTASVAATARRPLRGRRALTLLAGVAGSVGLVWLVAGPGPTAPDAAQSSATSLVSSVPSDDTLGRPSLSVEVSAAHVSIAASSATAAPLVATSLPSTAVDPAAVARTLDPRRRQSTPASQRPTAATSSAPSGLILTPDF